MVIGEELEASIKTGKLQSFGDITPGITLLNNLKNSGLSPREIAMLMIWPIQNPTLSRKIGVFGVTNARADELERDYKETIRDGVSEKRYELVGILDITRKFGEGLKQLDLSSLTLKRDYCLILLPKNSQTSSTNSRDLRRHGFHTDAYVRL